MRMPFWAELRWFIASKLFKWTVYLIKPEMGLDLALAIKNAAENFEPEERFNTVKMKQPA